MMEEFALASMRAVVFDRYGGPEVLRETWIKVPTPKEGEVLVRVSAASVNGYDVAVRAGALKVITGRKFPQRTGLDFAGEVEAKASGSQFQIGDRVWGTMPLHQLGSAAEFVCVQPRQLALSPDALEPFEAAALPVVGVTAITALCDVGQLRQGHRLLIRGAGGGVGIIAVQLGRALGAHVTGVARAGDRDFVRSLGADTALDYAATAPINLGKFDLILDTVGSNSSAWRRLLAPGGRMVAIVPDPLHPLKSMIGFALSRVHGERRIRFFSAKPDTKLLDQLAGYVRQGAIRPVIAAVHGLSGIAAAHRAMEAGGQRGKQVVSLT